MWFVKTHFPMIWVLVVLEQAFILASNLAACVIIVRVSLLNKKWWTERTLPRDMLNNFSEAAIQKGGRVVGDFEDIG